MQALSCMILLNPHLLIFAYYSLFVKLHHYRA